MLLLAVVQIGYQYSTTGDFINRGVELKGGITLTIPEKSYDISELQEMLNSELEGDITVRRISQTKESEGCNKMINPASVERT